MTPQITIPIPQQNIELIRDQICGILGVELPNQYALDNTNPNIPLTSIWRERFIPFSGDLEVPAVNVSISAANFTSKNDSKRDGEMRFNVDVYTNGKTDAFGSGDTYAMVAMNRVAAMIGYILSSPSYKRLALSGIVARCSVEGYQVLNKSNVQDALLDVFGRVYFCVYAIETVGATPGNIINESTAKITFSNNQYGFYLDSIA